MNTFDAVQDLPTYLLVLLALLIVCQLGAMAWALLRLWKDKRERIAGLPRSIWTAIILMGQLLGPVVFLIMHIREERAMAEQKRFHRAQKQQPRGRGTDVSSVIDGMYKE
ncbi:hypothetical protein [Corynebacterium sp. TAE3-ERU2]|uniref:hypothetical protein n=1 Tax=Corynebacterium sp. TAE3-ERU2 TaxID=2849497 RepID=UPI001C439CD3|nr:hypothetical protein [Corynebacterium sp. TAE3-ERU2]MBV7302203.1 hypothetical protein [Corynebacterium sp. TAE3-ERU2]